MAEFQLPFQLEASSGGELQEAIPLRRAAGHGRRPEELAKVTHRLAGHETAMKIAEIEERLHQYT